jgi:hypothetical protein
MRNYIENTGFTETLIQDNNNKIINNKTEWNANYDGKRAKIKINKNNNGKKEKINMKLSNRDLEQILSVPAINKPLEIRLKENFLDNHNYSDNYRNTYKFLDDDELNLINLLEKQEDKKQHKMKEACYYPHSELKPEPALFRLTIPQKKELLKSPFPSPCPCKSNICEHKVIQRPRLSKREKHIRLKTPSPKTTRIQYTSKSSSHGTRRKKHRKTEDLNKFFKLY